MSFAAATIPSKKDRFYTEYGKRLIHPKGKPGQHESLSSWKKYRKPQAFEVERLPQEDPIALSPADSTTIFISSKDTWVKEKQIQYAYSSHIKELEEDLQEMLYWYDAVYTENLAIKKQHGADQVLVTEGFGEVLDNRTKLRREEEPHKHKINKLIQDVKNLNRTNKELHEHLNNLRKQAPSIDEERQKDAKKHRLYWETKYHTSERDSLKKKYNSFSEQLERLTGVKPTKTSKTNQSVELTDETNLRKYVHKKKTVASNDLENKSSVSRTENHEHNLVDTSSDLFENYLESKRHHDRLCAEKGIWAEEKSKLAKISAQLQEELDRLNKM